MAPRCESLHAPRPFRARRSLSETVVPAWGPCERRVERSLLTRRASSRARPRLRAGRTKARGSCSNRSWAKETRTLDPEGLTILARSFSRALREGGWTPKELLLASNERL